MDDDESEFERTMTFAEAALAHLRRNRIPATPRNFEVWFNYARGVSRALSEAALDAERPVALDSVLGRGLIDDDAAAVPSTTRLRQVGNRVAGEIDDVERVIADALAATTGYGKALREAADDLALDVDAGTIRQVVQRLAASTGDVERRGETLRQQLASARIEMIALHSSIEAIRHESLTDTLTNLGNRKLFDISLDRAITDANARGEELALLIADVDHFKQFNDTYGHQTGDQVLRLVARTLKDCLRPHDVACRYGGEEFAIISPQTSLADALLLADRVRHAIAGRDLIRRATGEHLGRVTVSMGVAALGAEDDSHALIGRADGFLYRAKAAGRNQIVTDVLAGRPRDVA
jgi:diguanylate cyclase